MSTDWSVSEWIEGVKIGDDLAAQELWERYFQQLVQVARQKFQDVPRREADEEDVALSALNRFFLGAKNGRFPRVSDRDDLWRLLLKITADRTIDQMRREGRLKRGAGQVLGESALQNIASSSDGGGVAHVTGDLPTPEFAVMFAEQCGCLLDRLEDDDLRAIALAKLEGYANQEIAEQLGCALRTVERRLQLIRKTWKQEMTA
jgi:RNA polymerase sigma factor (sigma-70 family)